MKKAATFFLALLATGAFVSGGSFVNLDFDSASLPSIPFGQYGPEVPISQALPGWSGFLGTNPAASVLHNNAPLGSAAICIWGPGSTYGYSRIEGTYTVWLVPGGAGYGPSDVTLSQTGNIPSTALSLLFKAGSTSGRSLLNDEFAVYANNTILTLTPLAMATNYTVYGADVSSLAGQQINLKFTEFGSIVVPRALMLDSIVFSPDPIPEPGIHALLLCSGLLIVLRRSAKRFRPCRRECLAHRGA